MKKTKKHIFPTILMCGFLILAHPGCDASRRNPLDPANPEYSYTNLSGTVHTLSLPRAPIPGVTIQWKNEHAQTETDPSGTFVFEDINPENGWLYFNKPGFLPDSFYVNWQELDNRSVAKYLNAQPQMDHILIYSRMLHLYGSRQTEQLDIKVQISDPDNDIDSLYIKNTHLNLYKHLDFNSSTKYFEKTFLIYDLNVKSLEQVVGHDFTIIVKDKYSHVIQVGQNKLKRVIHDEVQFSEPSGYQQVTLSPELKWKKFEPGFDFTYTLQIFTDDITPIMVWEKTDISAETTSFIVDRILPRNDYFWVIWCVDEFHNSSRSKPASFTVN